MDMPIIITSYENYFP